MHAFWMPLTTCRCLRRWLTQSWGCFAPFLAAFSPQRFPPHPLCAPTHELPCRSLLRALLTTCFHFILYSAGGSLPWFLSILQSQTCLSSPVTPWVWSSLRNTFLLYLTAPQLLLLLFSHFRSQQKSWLRSPGLINIDTTNIPSLGTNWHGWAPAEVRDKLILWRCLPLKWFLVSWKDNLSILLLKKLQMSPIKGNQPAAVHISTVTPYRNSQAYSMSYAEWIFSLWTQNKCTKSLVISNTSLISFITSILISCITEDFIRQFTSSESQLGEERVLSSSDTDKGLKSAANILTEHPTSQQSFEEYHLTKGYFPVI